MYRVTPWFSAKVLIFNTILSPSFLSTVLACCLLVLQPLGFFADVYNDNRDFRRKPEIEVIGFT